MAAEAGRSRRKTKRELDRQNSGGDLRSRVWGDLRRRVSELWVILTNLSGSRFPPHVPSSMSTLGK